MTDTNIVEVTVHVPDHQNFVIKEQAQAVAESVKALLGGPGRHVHVLIRVNGSNTSERLWPPVCEDG